MKRANLAPVPGCFALAIMLCHVDDQTYQDLTLSNCTAQIATTFTPRPAADIKVLTVRAT